MPTRHKIDDKERKLRTEAVEYGFSSVRMEGLEPGAEAEAIASRFIEGELTHEEYHAEMRRLALDIARNGH
jgi:uncharacterized membrane protein